MPVFEQAFIIAGIVLLGAFVFWERRTPEPMVPLRFFRNRVFSAANVTSLLMSFGMIRSVFLLAQFVQVVQGDSPLESGIHTLPWTAMPILVAPTAGMFSDRIGARPLLVAGMALMAGGPAWMAVVTSPTVAAVAIPPKEDVVPDSVSLLERGERDGGGRARPAVEGELACEPDAAA